MTGVRYDRIRHKIYRQVKFLSHIQGNAATVLPRIHGKIFCYQDFHAGNLGISWGCLRLCLESKVIWLGFEFTIYISCCCMLSVACCPLRLNCIYYRLENRKAIAAKRFQAYWPFNPINHHPVTSDK
jgi:hypothetical protein